MCVCVYLQTWGTVKFCAGAYLANGVFILGKDTNLFVIFTLKPIKKYRNIPNRRPQGLDKSLGGYIRFKELGKALAYLTYKRNLHSKLLLGGGSNRDITVT